MKLVRLAVLLGVWATASFGAISAVNSRGALGGNDYIDWSLLGNPLLQIPSPFTTSSNLGNNVTLTDTSGTFQRRNQGNGWNGNFAPGTPLLYTFGLGPTTFDFSQAIGGFGFDINPNQLAGTTATLTVFGAGNVLLGTENFSINGISSTAGPTFIGVVSNLQDITRIVLSTPTNSYAFNRADILSEAGAIPEPASMTLMGLGLAAVVFGIRRRKA